MTISFTNERIKVFKPVCMAVKVIMDGGSQVKHKPNTDLKAVMVRFKCLCNCRDKIQTNGGRVTGRSVLGEFRLNLEQCNKSEWCHDLVTGSHKVSLHSPSSRVAVRKWQPPPTSDLSLSQENNFKREACADNTNPS